MWIIHDQSGIDARTIRKDGLLSCCSITNNFALSWIDRKAICQLCQA